MSTAEDYELQGAYGTSEYSEPKGAGWITFAAIMLALVGTWNFLDGILAISSSHVYTENTTYVFSDLRTWGWIMLVLGIVQGLAALAILSGRGFGRWFGMASAGVNALGQLMFIPVYPFWGATMFAVDILIIYALAAYGGRRIRQAA